MKHFPWRWILPGAQLVFAIACHVYDGHAYRVALYNDRANDDEYYGQHSPAWPVRVSSGINFPAVVLNYPFRDLYHPMIYEHNSEFTLIDFYPRDIGFFCCVVLFWYWAGRSMERNSSVRWGPAVRRAGLAGGVVFGIVTGVYAEEMIGRARVPEVQMGSAGIVWALALTSYFIWHLVLALTARERARQRLKAG